MSSNTWTQYELQSEIRDWKGIGWRFVEIQNQFPTMELVDNTSEQAVLERVLETTKPIIPTECEGLHYLLFSPFRYAPYPKDSRFRKSESLKGVFYAAESVETALHETVFYYLLNFFAKSPSTLFPVNPRKYTAFSVSLNTNSLLDLTSKQLKKYSDYWTDLENYSHCHDLAGDAHELDVEIIRYSSVRDVNKGPNLAVLSCKAFKDSHPVEMQTWEIRIDPNGVEVNCDFPRKTVSFAKDTFSPDSRLENVNWDRNF